MNNKMKTKKISLMLVLSMIIQLMSFSAFASTAPAVTGWHADTTGVYVYFNTAVTAADVLAGTTLTSNGVAVPFTVEERTMAANSLGTKYSAAKNYIGDTTIKIIPTGSKLAIDKEYDLVIKLSGEEILNKYFKITELYFADFSSASQITDDWWQNKKVWDLIWDEDGERMEVKVKEEPAETGNTRTLGINKFKTDLNYSDYTVEFDLYRKATTGYPILKGLRWQDTAAKDGSNNTVYPNTDYNWGKYHAYTNLDQYNNGMRIKAYDGQTASVDENKHVPLPDFTGDNSNTGGIKEEQDRQYHWTYAMQLGNQDLGVFIESDMTNGTVKEFKMADANIGMDGGGFSFDVRVRNAGTDAFYLDNVHVTKTVEVARAVSFAEPDITYSTGDTVAEAETISGTVNIQNTYSVAKPAAVIMAAYDSITGQMKNVDILYNNNLAVGTNSIPITSFNVEGADMVKVFAFDDLDTIVPYTEPQIIGKNEYYILAFGNSYSENSFSYLSKIGKAAGVDIYTVNMYEGGCPLSQHYNYMNGNGTYEKRVVITPDGSNTTYDVTFADGLATNGYEWDYITLHEKGLYSPFFENFYTEANPYITQLADHIRERFPSSEVLFFETWAPYKDRIIEKYEDVYKPVVEGLEEDEYVSAVFEEIKANYLKAAETIGNPNRVIPAGEAVYRAIKDYGFAEYVDNGAYEEDDAFVNNARAIYADKSCHMTSPYGKVLVALTWYEYLTDRDVRENPYTNESIPDEDMEILKQIAHEACSVSDYHKLK